MRTTLIWCSILAINLLLPSSVLAETFVNKQLGFEFTPPEGFHALQASKENVVYAFANGNPSNASTSMILIERLRAAADPAKLTEEDLRRLDRPGYKFSLQEHPWKKTVLQVVRKDIDLSDGSVVVFSVPFPLKDEGVNLRIHGPKAQQKLIESKFSECVKAFNNLKTYAVKAEVIETAAPGTARKWNPQPEQLAKLGEFVSAGRHKIRLPDEYVLTDSTPKDSPRPGRHLFDMSKNGADSARSRMTLLSFSDAENVRVGDIVAHSLNGLKKKDPNCSIGTIEQGEVNGIPGLRARYTLTSASDSYAGFVLSTKTQLGTTIIQGECLAADVKQASRTLLSMFTSALTLQENTQGMPAEKGGFAKQQNGEDNTVAAVQLAWNEFKEGSLAGKGEIVANRTTSATFGYYDEIQTLAYEGSRNQLNEHVFAKRFTALGMRLRIPADKLRNMTGRELFVHSVDRGWIGKDSASKNDIGSVAVNGDHARAEILVSGQPTSQYFHFIREDGIWRLDMLQMMKMVNVAIDQMVEQSGMSEEQFAKKLLEATTGKTISEETWTPPSERIATAK